MNWADFLHADCNAIVLVRPTSHSRSLAFKFQSTERPLVVVGMTLWSRLCPSFPPDICLGVFLELDHYISLNSDMVPKTLMKLCMTSRLFEKLFLPLKFGKWVKIRSKIVLFLNLKKNLVINFHWICSVMKIFIICCVHTQIIGYGQSGLWTLKLTVSQECINGINWFFACWYNFMQIKSWLKILGVVMVKNESGWIDCVSETEKMEWTDFWHAGTYSGKLKVDSVIFGWAWSNMAEAI